MKMNGNNLLDSIEATKLNEVKSVFHELIMTSRFASNIPKMARRNFRAAFTFVELLVVLGVIGILAVTLLPALAASQAKSRQAQCLNNMHQFGLAIQMYANDNQDYLPWPNWGLSPGNANGPGWLYQPVSGAPPISINLATYQKGLLWRYIQNINTYRCPVDASTTNLPSSSYPLRPNKMSTYVMNAAANDFYNTIYPAFKITAIKTNAVILWEPNDRNPDGSPNGFSYNDGANLPVAVEGPGLWWHNPGTDLLYLDGHVTFMNYNQALNLMSSTTPNEFWWDPNSPNTGGAPDGRGN